jgi:hypothetical protein
MKNMPYVFVTSYLPYNKTTEAAKKYVSVIKAHKSSIKGLTKTVLPDALIARKDYIEVTGIYDVEESKLNEFLLAQQKYMTNYHQIEGYSYDIEVRFKITEALEAIGIKPPE